MSVRTDLPPQVLTLIDQSFTDRVNKVLNSSVVRINRPVSAQGLAIKFKNWALNKIDNITIRPNDYSGGNLDNAFEKNPTSLDDALERCMSLRDLNNLTKLFERCRNLVKGAGVSPDAVWDGLRWVRRGWSTSSFGFDFACKDRVLQRQLYDQLVLERRLVKDGPSTAAEHPGCSCWRELPKDTDSEKPIDVEVLHLLLGDGSTPGVSATDQERLDQIHIDFKSPCKSTSVDVCEGGVFTPAKHAAQVFLNIGIPVSPFTFPDVDAELQAADKRGFVTKAGSAKAAILRAEFAKFGRTWACQGYTGEAEAQIRFQQLEEIRDDAFQREAFARAMEAAASGI